MLERYPGAVGTKDVEAFLALYADDVRTFDLWSVWSYDGKEALRGMAEEWFGSLGTDLVAVEFDEVRTQAGDDVAALSAFTTYRGLSTARSCARRTTGSRGSSARTPTASGGSPTSTRPLRRATRGKVELRR